MKRNTAPITPELCDSNRLLFFPASKEEAALIQRALFAMGYIWGEEGENKKPRVTFLDECVATGMVLKSGELYFKPSAESYERGLLCTVDQLDADFIWINSPSLKEKFNALAAQVQAIHDEVMPKNLDKGFFIKKDPKP